MWPWQFRGGDAAPQPVGFARTVQRATPATPAIPTAGTYPNAISGGIGTADEPTPLGFANRLSFLKFTSALAAELPGQTVFVLQGSSVMGRSFKYKGTGSWLFDGGRVSDLDISIINKQLFTTAELLHDAKQFTNFRTADHTGELQPDELKALGLDRAHARAQTLAATYSTAGRDVNFMLYKDTAAAAKHSGASLIVSGKETYLLGDLKF